MIKGDKLYRGEEIEAIVRKRFYNIINGKGSVTPRIGVRVAVDSLFNASEPSVQADTKPLCETCGIDNLYNQFNFCPDCGRNLHTAD
ncbi:MAG: hypothetical protein SVM79_00200 [Chloroflexota bacterium]|nr:hypothetical protein [Chloroflexota bacterium]